MSGTTTATAVQHEITVDVPRERAFALFTERFDDVKPRSHTLLRTPIARSVLEPFVGGRLYDLAVDGTTLTWGQVLACDPPGLLVFSWQPDPRFEIAGARAVSLLLGGGSLGGSPRTSWYSDLPTDSSLVPLGTAWRVIDCKHRTPDHVDGGYPVVSPGDVERGRLDLSACTRFVGEADFRDLADDLRRCRRGDIVDSRNASAGIAAHVDTDAPFTMDQDVCRITSDVASQHFFFHALNVVVQPRLEAVSSAARSHASTSRRFVGFGSRFPHIAPGVGSPRRLTASSASKAWRSPGSDRESAFSPSTSSPSSPPP